MGCATLFAIFVFLIQYAFADRSDTNSTRDVFHGNLRKSSASDKGYNVNRFEEAYNQLNALRMKETELNDTSIHSRRLESSSKVRHIVRIEELVEKVKVDDQVLVTMVDFSYLEAFYISYTVSRLWRFPNFMVVALNQHAYDVLEMQGFPVALVKSSMYEHGSDRSSHYEGHLFNQMMALKMVIIHKILRLKVGCLYFDSDVIIFRDPFEYVPVDETPDFIAQKDVWVCAGFVYWYPTKNARKMVRKVLLKMAGREIHDQTALDEVIRENLVPDVTYQLFPIELYNRGNIFFERHQFCWTPIDKKLVMAHNNFVMYYTNKIYRLKETGLYPFDLDHEYSDLDAKYLVLERYNTFSEQPLVKLIELGNALSRHIVLPSFICPSQPRPETECNLCGHMPINCHYQAMKRAELPWKEHVFFHNKHVPEVVKKDYLEAHVIRIVTDASDCQYNVNAGERTECIVADAQHFTRSVVAQLALHVKDRVIRLQSIPDVFN